MKRLNVQSLALQLHKVVECPVCVNKLDSSHSLCKNGHGVCSGCRSKLDKCPICQEEFLLHKATLLNHILEALPKICAFADRGCTQMELIDGHEIFCGFRPSQCKIRNCLWIGSLKDLILHIERSHKEKFLRSLVNPGVISHRVYTIPDKKTLSYFSPLICNHSFFWKYFHRDSTSKRILHRLYYLPIFKPTRDYYLTIGFKKGQIESTITCKSSINMDDGDLDFDCNDSYLVLPDCLLEKHLTDSEVSVLPYTLKIFEEEILSGEGKQ